MKTLADQLNESPEVPYTDWESPSFSEATLTRGRLRLEVNPSSVRVLAINQLDHWVFLTNNVTIPENASMSDVGALVRSEVEGIGSFGEPPPVSVDYFAPESYPSLRTLIAYPAKCASLLEKKPGCVPITDGDQTIECTEGWIFYLDVTDICGYLESPDGAFCYVDLERQWRAHYNYKGEAS